MKNLLFIVLSVLFLANCASKKQEESKENLEAEKSSPSPSSSALAVAPDLSKNPDLTAFAAEVDTDNDGKMTKIEWKARGLPETSFKGFEKGRGFVTIEDYQKNPAPDGIDGNKDGKLTVAEFVAFDKIMSAKMKAGNMPPPPK